MQSRATSTKDEYLCAHMCGEKGTWNCVFFSLRKLYQLESYKYSCDTIGRTGTYSCAVRCEGDVGFLER